MLAIGKLLWIRLPRLRRLAREVDQLRLARLVAVAVDALPLRGKGGGEVAKNTELGAKKK
jgi:hypothetical protein